MPAKKNRYERFLSLFNRPNQEDCWEWNGKKNTRGYGHFHIGPKRIVGAHRVAYALRYGRIPDGLNVCHICDNPGCVNPRHLFVGTQKDNVADRERKGRMNYDHVRGENNCLSKLLRGDTEIIRRLGRLGLTHRRIATVFGVSHKTVFDVIHRNTWQEEAYATTNLDF